eukprot:2617817-Rhodomonas_salina.1
MFHQSYEPHAPAININTSAHSCLSHGRILSYHNSHTTLPQYRTPTMLSLALLYAPSVPDTAYDWPSCEAIEHCHMLPQYRTALGRQRRLPDHRHVRVEEVDRPRCQPNLAGVGNDGEGRLVAWPTSVPDMACRCRLHTHTAAAGSTIRAVSTRARRSGIGTYTTKSKHLPGPKRTGKLHESAFLVEMSLERWAKAFNFGGGRLTWL